MNSGDIELALHWTLVDCQSGVNAYLNTPELKTIFSSLPDPMAQEILRLAHPIQDKALRDVISEITIVFLMNATNNTYRGKSARNGQYILAAELCVAEKLYRTLRAIDMDFGPGDLWQALLHFEIDEKVPPFSTDYFSAHTELRNRFISHACLDACMPGGSIPEETIAYAAENMELLVDICSLVHHRGSFSVGMIQEFIGASTRSLALGVL